MKPEIPIYLIPAKPRQARLPIAVSGTLAILFSARRLPGEESAGEIGGRGDFHVIVLMYQIRLSKGAGEELVACERITRSDMGREDKWITRDGDRLRLHVCRCQFLQREMS